MTKKDLLEALEPYSMDQVVMIEASESGYQFSDINSVKKVQVDYEHADESIEEIDCVIISEQ